MVQQVYKPFKENIKLVAIHLYIRSQTDLQNVKKGHSLTLLGKIYIHKTSFSVFPSKTPPAISVFWPFEFLFWWNLRRPKQFSSIFNMHPNDRFFPLIASVLQTSVAVGGPNTCNLAAGQILAQHTLAMNYLEMASVPQIHLCFVLGLLFFSQCNQNQDTIPIPIYIKLLIII